MMHDEPAFKARYHDINKTRDILVLVPKIAVACTAMLAYVKGLLRVLLIVAAANHVVEPFVCGSSL